MRSEVEYLSVPSTLSIVNASNGGLRCLLKHCITLVDSCVQYVSTNNLCNAEHQSGEPERALGSTAQSGVQTAVSVTSALTLA